MVRDTNGSQLTQPAAMPSTAAPARQSLRVSHQARQKRIAGIDSHQIAGLPIASTSDTYGPVVPDFARCVPAASVKYQNRMTTVST